MTDHFDIVIACQSCTPPVRCESTAVGVPQLIGGAGWETNTHVGCPVCGRQFLVHVVMTPTFNPTAKLAQVRAGAT